MRQSLGRGARTIVWPAWSARRRTICSSASSRRTASGGSLLETADAAASQRDERAGADVTTIDSVGRSPSGSRPTPRTERADDRAPRRGQRRAPALRRRELRRARLGLRPGLRRTTTRASRPSWRASRARRPARLHGVEARPKLGELYRRFTDEPLGPRVVGVGPRARRADARRGLRARVPRRQPLDRRGSGEGLWELFSTTAPPVMALLDEARRRRGRGVPPRVRRALRGLPQGRRHLRAAPLPADDREAALTDEAVELLQELIRVDTSNPPGNETRGGRASPRPTWRRPASSASCTRGCPSGRTSSRASRAAAARRSRCSRTPTSFADAREWSATRSGELATTGVWGRGALDMKGQVAASAVALASLAREGWRRAATSSSSPRPTRRSATASASSGSCASIRTPSAPTTRSTRAAASASRSPAASSTSARPRRR